MTNRTPGRPATAADLELFAHIEAKLYTAVIADSLDTLGYREQVMDPRVRPVTPRDTFAGFARTISCTDMFYIPPDPYALELEAIDSILTGEVVVMATGQSTRNAPWGELLSTAARARGARGAIVDGYVRDVKKIEALGFPLFAVGMKAVDSKGRGLVIDYNCPVECGGVLIAPGDLLVTDFDGVVSIPSAAIEDCIRLATEKVSLENHTRDDLMKGAYLRDVYAKYGVL